MEMVFHINNGLRCNKCGKEISYEEFIPKYMQAKTDRERIEVFKCDCGGNFEESVKLFKDDSKKVILRINGHDISSRDYLKLRKYILYQNLPDFFDDSLLPKQIRDNERKKSEILSTSLPYGSIVPLWFTRMTNKPTVPLFTTHRLHKLVKDSVG